MRINPISSTPFKGQVVIKIENKNCGDKKAPMSEILEISAKKNKTLLVGEDVIILDSSDDLKKDLSSKGILYTEENRNYYLE